MLSSLLVSEKTGYNRVPPPYEMRNDLFALLRKKYPNKVDEFRGIIKYQGIKIEAKARFINSIRRYFIYFSPLREKVEEGSKYYEELRKKTIDFIQDLIGDAKELKFCNIKFRPLEFGEKKIDISNWKFVLFFNGREEYITISQFFQNKEERKKIINDILESHKKTNKDIYIIYFEKDPIENMIVESRLQNLEKFLKKFVTNNVFNKSSRPTKIKEEISNSETLKSSFLIFIVHPNDDQLMYDELKHFLIDNQIPSQFISLERLDSQQIWSLKNNLSLEIIKKNLKNCIELKPLSDEINGFICLSDIHPTKKKLFGISITKVSESEYTDKIEIFSGIDYIIDENSDLMNIEEEDINRMVDKLEAYTELRGIQVDLHFTRRVNNDVLRRFIEKIEEIGIKVRKSFYISNMSTRFVFDRSILSSEYEYVYSIIDERVALVDVSGRVITHGNIFPIYLELLYPDGTITRQDIENTIWTIKKRTYRIDNFPALKLPETIKFFKSAKKSFCLHIKSNLTFPSPFII